MSTERTSRAPALGYNTDAKAEYREAVWMVFRQRARTLLQFCKVLIMPSNEGIEIEVAERWGVKRENIVAVDLNPAIAATLSRKYPGIKAWGMDVFDAPERAKREGFNFDVAHLDLTCNLSDACIWGLIRFATHIDSRHISVVNIMKGRESTAAQTAHKQRFIEAEIDVGDKTLQWMEGQKKLYSRKFYRKWVNRQQKRQQSVLFKKSAMEFKECREDLIAWYTGWNRQTPPRTYVSGRVPMMWSAYTGGGYKKY